MKDYYYFLVLWFEWMAGLIIFNFGLRGFDWDSLKPNLVLLQGEVSSLIRLHRGELKHLSTWT